MSTPYYADRSQQAESTVQKAKRKMRENPFVVPAVALAFVGMGRMVVALHNGNKTGFQYAQRFKVSILY